MIRSADFFSTLKWIDGAPLQIEDYRQKIFSEVLDRYRDDGVPYFNFALAGRGKKNHKSTDLILAGLFVLMCRESPQGSDALIIANDEAQAGQDLDLAKKLVRINGLGDAVDGELEILDKEIRRRDGKGSMQVVPAKNVAGQHGRTAAFIGFDEIWAYRDHSLFEALAVDPTRYCLTWVTSYDLINDSEGFPLHDFKKAGMAGSDPRMYFSWYSGDYTTDPAFANLEPELRANPSMGSWPDGRGYLDQQRRRLPSAKFRRLHLNLPGAPDGAHFDQATVERAIVAGRQEIPPQDGVDYLAFVDMSGGSSDDAVLALAHWDGQKAVLDLLVSQGDAPPPFNPRLAVARFAVYCKRYRCNEVHGDGYAGLTFRHDFSDLGIDYVVTKKSKTDLYEDLEVAANADQIELLEIAKLRRELLTIVRKGASLDHPAGGHDDWANAAAGALTLANPDIGNTTPAILTFMERQLAVAATSAATAPTVPQEHGREAVMQIGTRRPANFVRVVVPGDVSHVFGVSGTPYLVELENDRRVAWMSPDDARAQINSPLNVPFFEANAGLRAQLGKPAQPRGTNVDDWLQAMEDARPVDYANKGGMVRQTLEMLRRAR